MISPNSFDESGTRPLSGASPQDTPDALAQVRGLYFDLLRDSLTGMLDEDPPLYPIKMSGLVSKDYIPKVREWGKDVPSHACTMIGLRRMDNIRFCIEQVLADAVPGDCIETGVWRGGATIFMRGILAAYQVMDRTVWVADSFQGLPAANPAKYPADKGWAASQSQLMVPMDEVRSNFARYGLLDEQVRFLPGWFKDTLPFAPIQSLAVLRMDGDLYESTWDALNALYPRLSAGGFVIVDDYSFPSCRQAVLDYREQHGIHDDMVAIDQEGVFWRRNSA